MLSSTLQVTTPDEMWDIQEAAYQQALRLRTQSPQEVLGPMIYEEAFATKPTKVGCIDERIPVHRIGLVASSALMPRIQQKMINCRLEQAGIVIEQVIYHEHCGGLNLLHDEVKEKRIDVPNPITIGQQKARKLMRILGVKGEPTLAGYSTASTIPMTGYPGFHHARAITIDYSGRFDQRVFGLETFLISARYFRSVTQLIKEVGIALSIALGVHGFSGRFIDKPLAILLIIDESSGYPLVALQRRLIPFLQRYEDFTILLVLKAPPTVVT